MGDVGLFWLFVVDGCGVVVVFCFVVGCGGIVCVC